MIWLVTLSPAESEMKYVIQKHVLCLRLKFVNNYNREYLEMRNICRLCSSDEEHESKGINRIHDVSNEVDTGHDRDDY